MSVYGSVYRQGSAVQNLSIFEQIYQSVHSSSFPCFAWYFKNFSKSLQECSVYFILSFKKAIHALSGLKF